MKYIYLSIFTLIINLSQAQKKRNIFYKKDIFFLFGPSIFQGDLPSGLILSNKKLKDTKIDNSNINCGLGLRQQYSGNFGFKFNINFLQLTGNDAWGKYINRNLSFRTRAIDLSILAEYSILHYEKVRKNYHHHLYLGTGISLFYFNPKALYQGKYVALQPLSTEGQGLTPFSSPYSRISYALPFTIGYRYKINRRDLLGFEFCFRKTFTDYIDDVSNKYPDFELLKQKKGTDAVALSDRSILQKASPNTLRGNPKKGDNYTFINFTYSFILGSNNFKIYHKSQLKKSRKPHRI